MKEKTGSLHIMAPEVIKQRYGPKVDVWSIGIVTYMILNDGRKPINGSNMYGKNSWFAVSERL
jgi:serine/threonine protein kinase